MNRIERWFKRNRLKPIPVLITLILIIILVFIIILVATYQYQHCVCFKMKESEELRTEPNAVHPEIFPIKKGKNFQPTEKRAKGLYGT
ncbi:N-acetylmuramoyl-L-alanine amidase, partial [Staphylococcus simulans]